jgi:pimeloyl-ACP methyl ester carboxylesterase
MHTVTSKDGTTIAFDRLGEGPAIILVSGAITTRSDYVALATSLAPYFTVFGHDRRGRGESGDTLPYSVEREVEDIEAVVTAAGGSAFLFGHSSGAVLALEAARTLGTKITKLAVYEPPFIVDDSRPPVPKDYIPHLNELIAADRRGDAVAYFMTAGAGLPAEFVAQMRNNPRWAESEAVAPTIAYDGAIMGDTINGSPLPLKKWASVTVPALVLDGGASSVYMHNGALALMAILPNAQHRTLAGQDHGVAPEVLTPALVEFFLSNVRG